MDCEAALCHSNIEMTRKANNQKQNIFAQMYYILKNVFNPSIALKM